jgi:hypothetical protein
MVYQHDIGKASALPDMAGEPLPLMHGIQHLTQTAQTAS